MTLDELREALADATPGPWRWEMNRHAKQVSLSGANGDLTVMDFLRWGMSGAAPRFWRWSGRPRVGDPKRADELASPFPGREHHADWCADIDDPNARLIAEAPRLGADLLALVEDARAVVRWADALTQRKPSPVTGGRMILEADVLRVEAAATALRARLDAMEGGSDD